MGRKPRFSTDDILHAARELAITSGPQSVTFSAVGRAIGAPSGSLYHRFGSRDEMMATLWLRTIVSFQQGAVLALDESHVDAAVRRVIDHFFDWTDHHRADAALLLLFDARSLAEKWPDTLAAELRTRNRSVRHALRDFAERYLGNTDEETMDRVTFALVDLPYAAVRRHLPDRGSPSPWLRAFTLDAAQAAIGTSGDSPPVAHMGSETRLDDRCVQ